MWTSFLLVLALREPLSSESEPVPGDVFVNRSDVGELVVGLGPPTFNDDGNLVFKGWTQEATGFWGRMPELTFKQLKAGVGCCVSVFTKGRNLILALSMPESRRSNGEIASQIVTETRRFSLSRHEGWAAGCMDRNRYYALAIVDRRNRRAQVVSVVRGEKFKVRNIELAVPTRFDGNECSDLKALN